MTGYRFPRLYEPLAATLATELIEPKTLSSHHNGWRVSRQDDGPFSLDPPPGLGNGEAIELRSKATWQWAWDPPPITRSNWRAA